MPRGAFRLLLAAALCLCGPALCNAATTTPAAGNAAATTPAPGATSEPSSQTSTEYLYRFRDLTPVADSTTTASTTTTPTPTPQPATRPLPVSTSTTEKASSNDNKNDDAKPMVTMYFPVSMEDIDLDRSQFESSVMSCLASYNISGTSVLKFDMGSAGKGFVEVRMMASSSSVAQQISQLVKEGRVEANFNGQTFKASLKNPNAGGSMPPWYVILSIVVGVVAGIILGIIIAKRKRSSDEDELPHHNARPLKQDKLDKNDAYALQDPQQALRVALPYKDGLSDLHRAVVEDDIHGILKALRYSLSLEDAQQLAGALFNPAETWLLLEPMNTAESPDSQVTDVQSDSSSSASSVGSMAATPETMFHRSPEQAGNVVQVPMLEQQDTAGNTPLCLAAAIGSTQALKVLLAHHANVAARNHEGQSPLHLACVRKDSQPASVKELVEAGAPINEPDSMGYTPLVYACHCANTGVTKLLLDAHASTNWVDDTGSSLLIIAARMNEPELVRQLLQADPSLLGSRDRIGRTAVHWAAVTGAVDVLKELVEAKADVTTKCFSSQTALHLAAREGNAEVVDLLVDAQENSRLNLIYILERDQSGQSAMEIAVHAGHKEFELALQSWLDQLGPQTSPEPLSPNSDEASSAPFLSDSTTPKSSDRRKAYFKSRREQIKGSEKKLQLKVQELQQEHARLTQAVATTRALYQRLLEETEGHNSDHSDTHLDVSV